MDPTLSTMLPPADLEAENYVISAILRDPSAIALADNLTPEDFHHAPYSLVFRAAKSLHSEGGQTDLLSVSRRLGDLGIMEKAGGLPALAQMVAETMDTVRVDTMAALIKEKSIRRALIEAGMAIASSAHNPLIPVGEIRPRIEATLSEIATNPSESPQDRITRKFDRLLGEIRAIKTGPFSPALRDDMLLELAKKTGRSVGHLEKIYFKSLISDGDGPLMTLAELQSRVGEQSERWILNGLFAAGRTTLFHAPGGTGKTKFLLDLALSLVKGQDYGDFPVLGSKRVLVIQTDESESDLLVNLKMMGYPPDSPNLRIKTRFSIEYIPSLVCELEAFKPDLVIIDSLTSISRYSCISENDVEYARPVLELGDIAQAIGSHIVIIHHSSKGSDGSARGSSALEAAVSQVIRLDRSKPASEDPSDTTRTLTITKSRSRRPAKYELDFNPETHRWAILGEVGKSEPMGEELDTRTAILNLLRDNPGIRFGYVELAHKLGRSQNTIRKVASRLTADGLINKHWREGIAMISLGDHDPDRPPLIRIKGGITPGSGVDQGVDHPTDHPQTLDNASIYPQVIHQTPKTGSPAGSPDQPLQVIHPAKNASNVGPEADPLSDPPLIHPDPSPDPDQVDHLESAYAHSPQPDIEWEHPYTPGDIVEARFLIDEKWMLLRAKICKIDAIAAEVFVLPSEIIAVPNKAEAKRLMRVVTILPSQIERRI